MQFDERQYGARARARASGRRLKGLREVFVEGGANANANGSAPWPLQLSLPLLLY